MASMHVNLKHRGTGETDRAPVGFSWTVFLFGCFPPLFRGDMAWAGGLFAAAVVLSFLFFPLVLLMWLFVAFIYNEKYLKKKLNQGFQITSIEGGEMSDVARKLDVSERYILEHSLE